MSILMISNTAVLIIQAGTEPIVVYNRDLSNSVLFGPDSGIGGGSSANLNSYSILDPLGTVSFDGTEDVWASTLAAGAVCAVDRISGATDVGVSPVLISEQIATSGVFSLNKETVITEIGSTNFALLQTLQFGPFPITQSAYSIAFSFLQATSSETSPFCSVDMQWSSSVTGQLVARERWFPSQGNNLQQQYYGTGPTKGDTLSIQITNQAGHATVMGFLNLTQNSRVVPRDDWRQNTPPNVPTYTSATYEQSGNILGAMAPVIPANSNTRRILPLYSGMVFLNFIPPGTTNSGHIVINDEGAEATSAALAAQTIFSTNSSPNNQNVQIWLPRAVCSVSIFNDSANSGSFSCFITIGEQPQ